LAGDTVVRLPSFEQVEKDSEAYARASRVLHRESNPGNARPLVQRHGDRELWLTPPPIPLTTPEMDAVYELPYARAPHPSYGDAKIPAWDMIRILGDDHARLLRRLLLLLDHRARGPHHPEPLGRIGPEGDRELIRDKTGLHRHHLGYRRPDREHVPHGLQGQRSSEVPPPSCVFPDICPNLNTSHDALIQLYRKARELPGIKKVMVASGVRYDLAVKSPANTSRNSSRIMSAAI
jgi:hypothetical protein